MSSSSSRSKPAAGGAPRRGAGGRGKKVEEAPPVVEEAAPPAKTAEEQLEEQFAATLLEQPQAAPPVPLHAPQDVRWAMSAEEVAAFCFPAGEQHPRSRGRLVVLATQGPLVQRHSYTACLCRDCQAAVRDRRKQDSYCQRVFAGELFTEQNVPLPKGKKDATGEEGAAAAAASSSSAAAAAAARPAIPALSGVATIQSGTSFGSTQQQLGATLPASGLSAAAASSSSSHGTAVSLLRPDRPTSLHNAQPSAGPPLHPAYGTHTVDQMPFLCRKCAAHARSAAHVLGGAHGKHVLTALEVGELARRMDEEDLLTAYGRLGKGAGPRTRLSGAEERDFLAKLDGDKQARAKLNYTPAQLSTLLSPVPRLADSTGHPTALLDFYSVREVVLAERERRVARLGQMYPDAATKGDKDPKNLQDAAITMVHDHSKAKRRTALPQKQVATTARPGEESKQQPDSVNGVQWPGESMLSYALLARKFPPHHTGVLRTRLLHRHTHDVAELGPAVDNPAVQLSVALMRNTHLNDKTEGWNAHF